MDVADESVPSCSVSSLIVKFRKIFPDKSINALTACFLHLITGVNRKLSDSQKKAIDHKSLNLIEFKVTLIKNYRDKFTFSEIKDIFLFFDVNKNGRVELAEFVSGIRGILNDYRQRIVNFIFFSLDENMSGYIEESDLQNFFRKSLLPDILTGQVDPSMKSREFMEKNDFNCRISREEFTNYYLNKSVMISSDTKFKVDCMDEWSLRDEDANAFIANQTTVCSRNRSLRQIRNVSFSLENRIPSEVALPLSLPVNSIQRPTEVTAAAAVAAIIGQAISGEGLINRFDSSDFTTSDRLLQNAPSIIVDGSTDDEDDEDDGRHSATERADATQRALMLANRSLEQGSQIAPFTQRPPEEKKPGNTPSPKTIRLLPLGPHSLIENLNQKEIGTLEQLQCYSPQQHSIEEHSTFDSPLFPEVHENTETYVLDLNNYIISLRCQIEQQASVINFQEKAIDRQHDMIKALQATLGFSLQNYSKSP